MFAPFDSWWSRFKGKNVKFVYFEVRIEFGRNRRSIGGSGSPGNIKRFQPISNSQNGCWSLAVVAVESALKLTSLFFSGLLSTVNVFLGTGAGSFFKLDELIWVSDNGFCISISTSSCYTPESLYKVELLTLLVPLTSLPIISSRFAVNYSGSGADRYWLFDIKFILLYNFFKS